jgi:hypothetical protein
MSRGFRLRVGPLLLEFLNFNIGHEAVKRGKALFRFIPGNAFILPSSFDGV